MNRRGFLKGLAAGGLIVAAPAIVREGLAMPVKAGLGEPEEPFLVVPKEYIKAFNNALIQPYPVPAEVFHNLDGMYTLVGSEKPVTLRLRDSVYKQPRPLEIFTDVDLAELKKRYPDPPIHPSYAAGHPREGFEYQQKFIQEFLK